MQPTTWDQDVEHRRGHVPQISISDPTHHVTDAIAYMYGDNDLRVDDKRRPSFSPSPPKDEIPEGGAYFDGRARSPHSENSLNVSPLNERYQSLPHGSQFSGHVRNPSFGKSPSRATPPHLTRTPSTDLETANQRFPLNDIDYESSPAAVAQELSNLQAIRRMSMNVDASDPDFPSFTPSSSTNSESPSPTLTDDDAARHFWVPARLHPELAPKEFNTFLEDRVDRIRRRAGSEDLLSPGDIDSNGSAATLQRRKSRLSKTIESAAGYEDGAEVLERRRSQPNHQRKTSETTLQELGHLVNDQPESTPRISVDGDDTQEGIPNDQVILPSLTSGLQSLKRSTRTNYRRGSLRKGERVPFSRRVAGRKADVDLDDSNSGSPRSSMSDERVAHSEIPQTNPMPVSTDIEIRSGPWKRPAPGVGLLPSSGVSPERNHTPQESQTEEQPSSSQTTFHSRIARNGRTTAPIPGYQSPQRIPQIIETPPPPDTHHNVPAPSYQQVLPERKSSHESVRVNTMQTVPIQRSNRPGMNRTTNYVHQTLDDMANRPSLMPGTNTRTDAVTFIPTLTEDRKIEKKSKDKKDSGEGSTKKSSWSWLLGGEEKDKSKDKKEKEEKESSKKSKGKAHKVADKSHDLARLDLLQTAADGPRGRESLVLDRESVKLDEDRKPSGRKVFGGDGKKEKESGLFSSLFGGSKKKTEREGNSKKIPINRGLSPEPQYQILRADIDYNWTRFSILEERAIYRMAHIKLANPRRALYSQVLLSNFMYSYLAKVQQMHPQIQIPQYVSQKQQQQQEQQQQQQQDHQLQQQHQQRRPSEPQQQGHPQDHQVDEFAQWQRYQAQHDQGTGYDAPRSNTHSYGPQTNYIDDYDNMDHEQQSDSWSYQQRSSSGHESGRYGQQQAQYMGHDQHWDQRDRYEQQTRPPEDHNMW